MVAMHALPQIGAIRRKIVVGGVDQFLDLMAGYNFTTPGANNFTVDQPFSANIEIQGGQGGNGGNVPGSPGGTGGNSNLDGSNQSNGGAGGSSGYYSPRTVTDGEYYAHSSYAFFWNGAAWFMYWGGSYWGNNGPGYFDGTWTYYQGSLRNDFSGNGQYDYAIYRQTTVYDVPTFGSGGSFASVVTPTVTLTPGAHTANVGAAGSPGSGAGGSAAGHVKVS